MTFSFSQTLSPKFGRSLPVPLPLIALSFITVLALCSYAYSLRTAIGFAVEREDIVEQIAVMRASITELDGQYASLTKGLSLARAHELGFHDVTAPLYISLSPAPQTAINRAR